MGGQEQATGQGDACTAHRKFVGLRIEHVVVVVVQRGAGREGIPEEQTRRSEPGEPLGKIGRVFKPSGSCIPMSMSTAKKPRIIIAVMTMSTPQRALRYSAALTEETTPEIGEVAG